MRLRHIKNAEQNIYDHDIVLKEQENGQHFNFQDIFNNDNKVYLELGMGKGSFLCKNAIQNKNINYIGIEKYATVVLYAIRTYENMSEELSNLRFLCIDIKNILSYFDKKSIDKIYLNFSDPWPKVRHENRRLTSKDFLNIYRELLNENGNIEFKPDNEALFDYSIESLKENKYNISFITRDLHSENIPNIMTEYEEKFSSKGNKIFKLIASP